jgi:hypothetical protein
MAAINCMIQSVLQRGVWTTVTMPFYQMICPELLHFTARIYCSETVMRRNKRGLESAPHTVCYMQTSQRRSLHFVKLLYAGL